jgi:peptidoglycan/LPS O-acetylase OafA/YrhL
MRARSATRMTATLHDRRLPSGALVDFDWMRAAAAWAVLIGHVRGLYFVDYGEVVGAGRGLQLWYLLTGLGHQAVIVFFVLSGFFIGYSVFEAHSRGRFDWRRYAARRISRLYVVLVPALLLTYATDSLGILRFGAHATVYGGEVNAPNLELPVIASRLGALDFFRNLLQLQHVFGFAEYGSNGPLWSLPYEFWAYALFPLCLFAVRGPGRFVTRALAAAAACTLLGIARPTLTLYFAVWLMGALVAYTWLRRPRSMNDRAWPRLALGLAWLAFAATTVIARVRLLGSRPVEDLLLGLAACFLLMAHLRRAAAWEEPRGKRAASWLAGFSYTLYLIHYPIIVFIHAALVGAERWSPSWRAALFGGFIATGVGLLIAYPLSLLTERQTDRFRAQLEHLIRRSS